MKKNKLGLVKYLIILGIALWSLPTLADEIPVETPTSTPTPETETTSTPPGTTDPTLTPSSNLIIRYQDQIVWSGNINLVSTTYHDAINNLDYTLATPTVFSALVIADQQSDAFTISDAQNSQYGFYLNCLNVIISSTPENACSNWNYVVNSSHPGFSMDNYILNGGETIYIYFSPSWRITASTTTFPLGSTTTLQTWRYQFDNLIEPWILDPNNILDIAIPNSIPAAAWDTTIITTTQTDASSSVDYFFTTTGTYFINFNDYTKWTPNALIISVLEPFTSTTSTTSTDPQPPVGGGSGGGSNNQSIPQEKINETVEKLLNFIKSKQDSDGKIIDGGTSDWLAMSFGAKGIYAETIKKASSSLHDYIYNYPIVELDNELNNCAAYPRHILALLASGVSNTNTKTAALKNKLNACVQNNIFGQAGINDDIFGLLAAVALGENNNSPVVQTTLTAIQANQQPDGAFAYPGPFESPDLTGAAINALKYAQNNGATVTADVFTKAKAYLKAQQLADGGWGFGISDALTTSWAMMGINALGEGQNDWFNTYGKNPWHILTTLDTDHFTQSWDGNIDWFGTKHAIPALLNRSWPIVLTTTNNTQNTANSGATGGSNPTTSTTPENTSIITPTSTPTTTSLLVAPEAPAELENTILVGEILGEKIMNQSSAPKPTAVKRIAVAQADTTSVVEIKILQPTSTEPAKPTQPEISNTTNVSLDTGRHSLAKIILLISAGGALLIGIYLGLQSLKKK